MRKISSILMIMCFFCLICGCKKEDGEKTQNINGVIQETDADASIEEFEFNELERKLIVQNLVTNDILAEISLESVETIDAWREITDGYAVVKSVYDEDVDDVVESNGIVMFAGTSAEKKEYDFIVYDDALQIKEEINLKDLLPEEFMSEIQEYQSEPRISFSGEKIAWNTEDTLYMLDLNTGKLLDYKFSLDEFMLQDTVFVDDNKLGFFGSSGEGVVTTKYGYWDLNTNEVYDSEEEDYSPSLIRVSGEYLIINDYEDAITNKSSGKVLLYDCEKNQSSVIKVDNIESTFATITEDGDKIIAYTYKNSDLTEHMVRVYRVSDGKCISESPFTTDNGVYFYDFLGKDNIYYLVGSKDEEKVIYRAFTAE